MSHLQLRECVIVYLDTNDKAAEGGMIKCRLNKIRADDKGRHLRDIQLNTKAILSEPVVWSDSDNPRKQFLLQRYVIPL